jgi:hypothetical protein
VSVCVQHKGLPMYNKTVYVWHQMYTFQVNYFTSVEQSVWKKETSNVERFVFKDTIWMTWRSCIRASRYDYENNQKDALYRLIYSNSAQYVSGDVFAHHQEHLTVFTVVITQNAAGWCLGWVKTDMHFQLIQNTSLAACWVIATRYCKYSRVLLMMRENIARNMLSWPGIIN